jgi:hypothetical protein
MRSAPLELIGFPHDPGDVPGDEEALVVAAQKTIAALREMHALQDWHELDCAIVMETARGVTTSRGIAKSLMVAALLQARSRLPEPVVTEQNDELVEFEARRELDWSRAHSADLADEEDAVEV